MAASSHGDSDPNCAPAPSLYIKFFSEGPLVFLLASPGPPQGRGIYKCCLSQHLQLTSGHRSGLPKKSKM